MHANLKLYIQDTEIFKIIQETMLLCCVHVICIFVFFIVHVSA